MKFAVIDLGSNTFHLLIVEWQSGYNFDEVYRERTFVGLGDGGIEKINDEAIERGILAVHSFQKAIDFHQVDKVKITGTAALRSASNSEVFLNRASLILKTKIDIIDGQKEAYYIYKGVGLLSSLEVRSVIVDIGGGSTEFIICENGKMIWSESYLLGVGVMHAAFHHNEPIKKGDEMDLRTHIRNTISSFTKQNNIKPINTFIGASGSFEVLESMSGLTTTRSKLNELNGETVGLISSEIIVADLQQRLRLKGMPSERVKLIVVAMILIEEILKIVQPRQILVTPYALKEGLLAEMMESVKAQ